MVDRRRSAILCLLGRDEQGGRCRPVAGINEGHGDPRIRATRIHIKLASQIRVAFSSIARNTGSSSPGDELMTSSTLAPPHEGRGAVRSRISAPVSRSICGPPGRIEESCDSPHPEQNTAFLVGIGPFVDLRVGEGDPAAPVARPGEQPFLVLAAHRFESRVGAKVASLVRILDEVEELRPERLVEHVLPTLRAHHVRARFAWRDAKLAAGGPKRKVAFAEHSVAGGPMIAGLVAQRRQQRTPFEHMARHGTAGCLNERWCEIDRLDQAVIHAAARAVSSRIRIVHDQWNPRALFVKQLLFPEPVVAEIIP